MRDSIKGCGFVLSAVLLLWVSGAAVADDWYDPASWDGEQGKRTLQSLTERLDEGAQLGGGIFLQKAKDRLADTVGRFRTARRKLSWTLEIVPGVPCSWDTCAKTLDAYRSTCCWKQLPCADRCAYTRRASQIDEEAGEWRDTVMECLCCLRTLKDGWGEAILQFSERRKLESKLISASPNERDAIAGRLKKANEELRFFISGLLLNQIAVLEEDIRDALKKADSDGVPEPAELVKGMEKGLQDTKQRLEDLQSGDGLSVVSTYTLDRVGYYLEAELEVDCPYSTVEERLTPHCKAPGDSVLKGGTASEVTPAPVKTPNGN